MAVFFSVSDTWMLEEKKPKFSQQQFSQRNLHCMTFQLLLQSWTKLVKKIENFGHIFQSNLRNTPPEE